eukprot:7981524-Prorocentrum_lima.AAC.1
MADYPDPECQAKIKRKIQNWRGPESVLERWKSFENKQVLPSVREEDATIFADDMGRIIQRASPTYGSPLTDQ